MFTGELVAVSFWSSITTQEIFAFFPLKVVAVMVVLPSSTAVTSPLEETVATSLLADWNVTFLLYPSVKLTESCSILSVYSSKFPFSIFTAFGAFFTVTVHFLLFFFTLAIIVAFPLFCPLIFPDLLTVTIFFVGRLKGNAFCVSFCI